MNEGVLKHMGERPVPNVVHQDCSFDGLCLGVEDEDAFLLE